MLQSFPTVTRVTRRNIAQRASRRRDRRHALLDFSVGSLAKDAEEAVRAVCDCSGRSKL